MTSCLPVVLCPTSLIDSATSTSVHWSSMASTDYPRLPALQETNWTYAMRRDMQEIIPGIFLGPYAVAVKAKLSVLQNVGISHIVCIRHEVEARIIKPNFPDVFNYLVLEVADSPAENIIRHFSQFRDFVHGCFNCGGKVLVHGNAGISRSAALVISYLMEQYGLTYRQALSYVQQRRFCINPNEGFAQQLKEFEVIYPARRSLGNSSEQHLVGSSSSSSTESRKRKLSSEEAMET